MTDYAPKFVIGKSTRVGVDAEWNKCLKGIEWQSYVLMTNYAPKFVIGVSYIC